jgi:hypothetical protein
MNLILIAKRPETEGVMSFLFRSDAPLKPPRTVAGAGENGSPSRHLTHALGSRRRRKQ